MNPTQGDAHRQVLEILRQSVSDVTKPDHVDTRVPRHPLDGGG
jgi:hypothetical protein